MDFKKVPTKIFALGGIEEIGKNMYVIEHDDELFIVDCGIKFADENELLGVDAIINNFDYLVENQNKIKGLIITHAHEDHIGGIPYLLKTVNIPKIYTAKLTEGIIAKKLKEHKDLLTYSFANFNDNSSIKTKHFKIDFFRVCHSIPDSFGVCFETINGRIVETGDFRFDFSTQGDETDVLKIAEIGRRDVDVLLVESTNSETQGFSTSEKYVIEEIGRIIKKTKGRIFISTFASNLGRIEEIIEIGIKCGRKICKIGKSMETNIDTSVKVGFLNVSADTFIETRNIADYKDNEIMILCTGSQGEELAALNQMAIGKHPWITLKPSDTVILSSNPIPGNFINVENLVNKLYKTGVNLIQHTPDKKLHASGHATETEQQLMIKLVNPQYVVPIHGEYKMLKSLRKNAINAGINDANILQISNGQVLNLVNHKLEVTDEEVDAYDVYVDGNKINKDTTGLLKYRRVLSSHGVFNVLVQINRQDKKVIDLPSLATRGSFYAMDSQPLLKKMAYTIKEKLDQAMQVKPGRSYISDQEIRKICMRIVEQFIWRNKKKKPLVRTTIFDLSR